MRAAWVGLFMVGVLVGCGGRGGESPLAPTAVDPGVSHAPVSPVAGNAGEVVSESAITSSTLPQVTSVTAPRWDWAKAPKYRGFFYADLNDLGSKWEFVIAGRNFGSTRGQVVISGVFKAWLTSWTDTQIRMRIQSHMGSLPQKATSLSIVLPNGRTTGATIDIVPSIQTRVFGQCTWHAAKRRLESGLSIPMPSAYSTKGVVNASYVPASRDVLMFAKVEHTVFVESVTRIVVSDDRNGNRTVRYVLQITQFNARYDEAPSLYSTTHEVREQYDPRSGAVRSQVLVAAPKFNTATADGYWR